MKKRIRDYVKQFFLIDDTPHKVAGGAALGVFLGITPGEGVLSTLFFAYIFRLNRLAALAGVLAVNMWTTILILPLAAATGAFLFGRDYSELIRQFHSIDGNYLKLFFSKIFFFEITFPLLVGFFVVAGVIALAIYFLLLLLLNFRKTRRGAHLLIKDQK